MLSEIDYENILEFSCEIGESSLYFYNDIFKVISKYFNYNFLAFFPENMNTSSNNDVNRVYYTNFFSDNLEKNFIKEFKDHYHKISIFQPLNLPEKLLHKNLIKITDIMPYSNFQQTENFQFLIKYNLHYRLNINLHSKNVRLGTLCIFKSKEEGDFTDREFKLWGILHKILSQNYKNFLTFSHSLFEQKLLKKCYDNYSDGIIIWNNKLSVLEANGRAKDYCFEIAENTNTLNTVSYDNINGIRQSDNSIQKIINFLSYNLMQSTSNQDLNIISINDIYTVNTSVIITPTITGSMETTYFTCISKHPNNEPNVSSDKLKDFYNLTDRELEIINLIKKGFSNKEISISLYLSSNTIKTHITNIFKKLGVNSRTTLLNKIESN
ncbi:LuxR C-terminal-related transcriptional regulator [Clostridium sp.]|uniref:response regulator transcription factor n=1 Tax=Clostridium sp. TaxID=1506 RepID=UPI002FCA801C